MPAGTTKVIFVHNDDEGLLNAFKVGARKGVKKENDGCSLCSVLFKGKDRRRAWNDFTRTLRVDFQYMHRDRFLEQYHRNDGFPVAYLVTESAMTILISKEKLDAVKDFQEMKELVIDRLDSAGIIETHF